MSGAARANLLPLYAQVKERLQHDIEETLNPGDSLPPEPELEKRFQVSRITIRRALDELVTDGLIVRKQGKGTFVREPHIAQELTHLMSWTAMMQQLGYTTKTMSTKIDIIEPTRELTAMLQVSPDTHIVRIRRLRYANDEPICLMTNYLPDDVIPGLAQ